MTDDDLTADLVKDLLQKGCEAAFRARGSSMHPIIGDREKIVVRPVSPDAVRPGMVVLVFVEDRGGKADQQIMIIHRCRQRRQDGQLVIQGDSCALPDPPVPLDSVAGQVIEVEGRFGRIRSDSWWGGWLLKRSCGVPMFLAWLSEIRSWICGELDLKSLAEDPARLSIEKQLIRCALGTVPVTDKSLESAGSAECTPLVALMRHRLRESDGESGLPKNESSAEVEREAIFQSAQTEAALKWLHDQLEIAEGEALLCKGAALAWHIYPEPHTRPMADIDLLVREDSSPALVEHLIAAGATPAEPEYSIAYYLQYKNEVALKLPGRHWPVLEVHWRGSSTPWYNRCVNASRFWDGATDSVFGPRLKRMRREGECVHMIAHLAKHIPGLRPLWALDLALLSQQGMNWQEVKNWLIEEQLSLPGLATARWLEGRLPGLLPKEIAGQLTDAARAQTGWLEQRLFSADREGIVARLVEGGCQPGLSRKLGFLFRMVFPERSILEQLFPDYHSEPTVALHLRRIFRLLVRICERIAQKADRLLDRFKIAGHTP